MAGSPESNYAALYKNKLFVAAIWMTMSVLITLWRRGRFNNVLQLCSPVDASLRVGSSY